MLKQHDTACQYNLSPGLQMRSRRRHFNVHQQGQVFRQNSLVAQRTKQRLQVWNMTRINWSGQNVSACTCPGPAVCRHHAKPQPAPHTGPGRACQDAP